MEPPCPGPNVMLPALNLSDTPDFDNLLAYKKREAQWKQSVSASHRAWCLCGSYKNHFLPPNASLIKSSCGEEKDADLEDAITAGFDPGDADMPALEDGDDGENR
nr:ORF2 [Torque teno felis virus]